MITAAAIASQVIVVMIAASRVLLALT